MSQQDLVSALPAAVRHHQAGDFAAAERIYRQILSVDPRHADALHLLGVLTAQRGNPDGAIALINGAISIRPDFAEFHRNLGRIWADKGDLDRALVCYRQSASLPPYDGDAWCVLGVVLEMKRKWEEAIPAYYRALLLRPTHPQAKANLTKLLASHPADPLAPLAQELVSHPDSAVALENFAAALVDPLPAGEAEIWYWRAIELNPSVPMLRIRLGMWLANHNRVEQAFACYSDAIESIPNFAAAYILRGKLFAESRQFDLAIADHRKAVELTPESATSHLAMAETLEAAQNSIEAEMYCRKALALDPGSANTWATLGSILRTLGQFEEAAKCFRQSLNIKPSAGVSMLLTTITRETDEAEIQRLMAQWKRSDLAPGERVANGFALGKVLDEADRFDEAFECYAAANSMYREVWALWGSRFDAEALHHQVDETMATFTPSFFKSRAEWGDAADLPVFIVGMPRSGTTLVEQIAASHSQVFGAGELPDIGGYCATLGTMDRPELSPQWDRTAIAELAGVHREKLSKLGCNASRVIDKLPGNLMHLGLIATMFPRARVIVCRREARDNCLSCFFQMFSRDSQIFSYDLADCAKYYNEMDRLTAHWRNALPLRMLTVQYEKLVENLEAESRRLIDFLGLEWEAKCLEFHKTERKVTTASFWQVRQPIYNRSVGRWKHYRKHLGPLTDLL